MSGYINGNNLDPRGASANLQINSFAVDSGKAHNTVVVVQVEPYKNDSVGKHERGDRAVVAALLAALDNADEQRGPQRSARVFDDILNDAPTRSHNHHPGNREDAALAHALRKALHDCGGSGNGNGGTDGLSERDLLALIVLTRKLSSPRDQNTLLKAILGVETGRRGNDLDAQLGSLLGGGRAGHMRGRGGADEIGDLEQLLETVSSAPHMSENVRAKLQAIILKAIVGKLEKMRGPQAEFALLKLALFMPSLPPHVQKVVEAILVNAIIKAGKRDNNLVNLAMLASTVASLNTDAKQKLVPIVLEALRGELRAAPQNAQLLASLARSMGLAPGASPDLQRFLADTDRRTTERDLMPRTSASRGKESLSADRAALMAESNNAGNAAPSIRNAFTQSLASAEDAANPAQTGNGSAADRRRPTAVSAFTFDDDDDDGAHTGPQAANMHARGGNGNPVGTDARGVTLSVQLPRTGPNASNVADDGDTDSEDVSDNGTANPTPSVDELINRLARTTALA